MSPRSRDLVVGDDGRPRCPWGESTPDYRVYHDTEWGRPVHGDDAVFERLTLEAFQSGLSWLTILRKRHAFRAAFAGFEIPVVARFDDGDRERLLADAGIVRNRAKVDATIANARAAQALLDDRGPGALDALLWSFAPAPRPRRRGIADVPATTPESTALARELKRQGFVFVGPTTAYAAMQAMGLVGGELDDEASAALQRDAHDDATPLLGDLERAVTRSRLHGGHAAPLFGSVAPPSCRRSRPLSPILHRARTDAPRVRLRPAPGRPPYVAPAAPTGRPDASPLRA